MQIQRGFSLLEILVTLAIVIITLAMAIPSEKIFLNKSQDTVMSQQLLRAIYLARSAAITRNESVTLCASANLKTCANNWLSGYIATSANEVLSVYQNINQQGVIQQRFFPKGHDTLTFLPSGLTNIENGTIWYCASANDKARWAIVLSQSGRARMLLPDVAGDIQDSSGNILSCAI